MKLFWTRVHERLRSGENVFIALVVEHTIHSPGTTGARLAVFTSGETIGTIGGGVMESKVIDTAREALLTGSFDPNLCVLVHRKDGEGEKSGMMCAGQQTNLYYLLRADAHIEVLQAVSGTEKRGDAGILTFSFSNVEFDLGILDLASGQSWLRSSSDTWVYSEQILNLQRIGIFGGGHCGLALSRTMNHLGFHVTIVDDRTGLKTMGNNSFADVQLIVSDMEESATRISHPETTEIVVMTTDMTTDIRALKGALSLPFPFVGVMGSMAKIGNIRKALREEGFSNDELSRISGPVGISIQSHTPEEIAVSVAAQLLERRSPNR
ncbi:MAG: XdhC/CoxI family protein [Rhodothermia bacterium]|nr:MAG: XdhC/CoxI family protein [Rhodothermia bacterium]